ncbi:MAG: PDZ domain-containing protein, partial [Archangium sp.]
AEIVSIEQRQIGVRRSAVIEFLGFSPSIAAPRVATGARVTRREVQQHLAHPEQLIASVRLIPVKAEGKLAGFRALSVAAGSVLETLGLRRGDTLRAVNGVKLDDPSHAMSLYAQLPTARRFDVQLEREGTLITQSLTIDE